MRTLYFDCFSGASGDMILGSLVDLGADYRGLRAALARLGAKRFELRRRTVRPAALVATKIDVRILRPDTGERNFADIAALIGRSGLSPAVKSLSLAIFRRLCEAEAAAHGVPFARVHLHEAGAVDAIADICGAAWLIDSLAADRILVSPLNVGSGTIECRHGVYPVPGPATARLLQGVPVYADGAPGERVTPTGAAILTTIAGGYGPLPPMVVRATGLGAGDRSYPDRPNVVRAFLGEDAGPAPGQLGDVVVIETTIDDMNPQNYGYFLDRALAAGALEVFFTPVIMKKGRPGMLVTAIVAPGDFDTVARLIFRETTTIGLRWRRESRRELDRRFSAVSTPWGRVRVKVSSDAGQVRHAQPEYEDCRRLALERDVPLKDVQRAALAAVNADRRLSPGTRDNAHRARPAPSRAAGARRGRAAARRKRT